jgi:hypothetical protein
MVIFESSRILSIVLKKKKLYMLIHTKIKLGVYVWVDYYYQFKILLIDMIEVLCMIEHAFKSAHIFEKTPTYI